MLQASDLTNTIECKTSSILDYPGQHTRDRWLEQHLSTNGVSTDVITDQRPVRIKVPHHNDKPIYKPPQTQDNL